MNLSETARVLALCAAYDQRTVGETDVYAWQAVLDDVQSEDAISAVKAHYRRSRDRIMPADIHAWRKDQPAKVYPPGQECEHGYPHESRCPFCRRASMRAVESAATP